MLVTLILWMFAVVGSASLTGFMRIALFGADGIVSWPGALLTAYMVLMGAMAACLLAARV